MEKQKKKSTKVWVWAGVFWGLIILSYFVTNDDAINGIVLGECISLGLWLGYSIQAICYKETRVTGIVMTVVSGLMTLFFVGLFTLGVMIGFLGAL